MPEYCHICGGELPAGTGETPFCPHCGAPQLRLAMDLQNQGPSDVQEDAALVASTGTQAPPRPALIDWRLAIQCAAAVAAVGGLLAVGSLRLPILAPASILWVLSGSLITLGLYQNRRPAARMDARIGARIGVMVGICAAAGLAVPIAAAGVVARFGLRAMGGFDAQLAAIFDKVIQQSAAQGGGSLPPGSLGLIHSPEFRAAYVLFSCGVAAFIVLMFSAAGGAFAGLLRTRQRAAV